MRKLLLFLVLGLLFTSLASAEIIITQQPKTAYNLGEIISTPLVFKPSTDIVGSFNADLICSGKQINFYKNGVSLKAGEEKRMTPSLVLTIDLIGGIKGGCKIKAYIGGDYVLTNDFTISSLIDLVPEISTSEIFPKESFIVKGSATKQSGAQVAGFIEAKIYPGEISANITPVITQLETIGNGYFEINITTPGDMKAGEYVIMLRAYEKDSLELVTNEGYSELSVSVKQVPTNIEIILETAEVEPGTPLKAKTILHDQTGQNIPVPITIKIKNHEDKLLEKFDIKTDEGFEFPTAYNEPPENYKIIATSSDLESEITFKIKEKQDLDIKVINKTLIITNVGNVPYCNKTVLVKIGGENLNVDLCLEVDEEEKYKLSAPDGQYKVEIITDEEKLEEITTLTGSAVDIKEVGGTIGLSRHPFIWIFVILILGFVAFTIYRKGYKRSFIGRIHLKRKKPKTPAQKEEPVKLAKGFLIPVKERAEICLTIKGNKQNSSVLCLRIKNFPEVAKEKESIKETVEKIAKTAEENKAVVYENGENIFFILAPIKTKTFQNEKRALKMAQELKALLDHHNKMFKQKIDFGISLNYGTIVVKKGKKGIEFMSMGDLMTKSKKIAGIAKKDFLLSEKMREKLVPKVKVDKITKDKTNVYKIKEIRDTKENERFIRQFLDRLEKGKK
jgi:hypothetical protein